MTDNERKFASIGWGYCEGIELSSTIIVPETGRQINKKKNGKWECQPFNDNYWAEFDDLFDAAKFATGK